MSNVDPGQSKKSAVQTTGHAWDGDIQEYNNPVPRWWIWAFYATVIFSVVYSPRPNTNNKLFKFLKPSLGIILINSSE